MKEYEGRSLEEALQIASLDLFVPVSSIKYEQVFIQDGETVNTLNRVKIKVIEVVKQEIVIENEPVDYKLDKAITDKATEIVSCVFNAITDGIKINCSSDRNLIIIDLDLDEAKDEKISSIFGKNRKTLNSLEYLCNAILQNSINNRILNVKLVLESSGYQKKKEEEMVEMAKSNINSVLSNRKVIRTPLLSPQHRKIYYAISSEYPQIEVKSEGYGVMKIIKIYYKNKY